MPDNSSGVVTSDVVNASKVVQPARSVNMNLYDSHISNTVHSVHANDICVAINSTVNVYEMNYMPGSTAGQQLNTLFPENHSRPVPRGETNPNIAQAGVNLILCTIDFTNIYWFDYTDTSVHYYIYLHKNSQKPPGFYFLHLNCLTGHSALVDCCSSPAGPLWIQASMQLYIAFCVEQFQDCMKLEARRAYDNYYQDCFINRQYGRTYECHMGMVIDHLINLQVNSPVSQQPLVNDTKSADITSIDVKPIHNSPGHIAKHKSLARDINDPDKTRGYIAIDSTDFEFIGPDRPTVNITNVAEYIKLAHTIRSSGLPNYRQARIPIKSGLKIDAWKRLLQDYPDKKLLQYLEYGFPLSIANPDRLNNHEIHNHFSALQHPKAIQEYLVKEQSHGAILGPVQEFAQAPEHREIHCSPLLTRPKDTNKHRVILDLSHPQGLSVNSQVDSFNFDGSSFVLKFPSIDDIVQEICSHGDDVTIAKIDVARAFRNLRVDPADALKLGIKWQDDVFIDVSVAFGWVHGSASFQRVSDAVTFLMAKSGAKMFAYIDDYILISPEADAQRQFRRLASLLTDLGLPSNPDKQTSPCRKLTCLGIQIDLDANTLSIHPDKLQSIYSSCLDVSTRRHLTRTQYQSLLGKLLYIHKCVKPARTFINRMLALFRTSNRARKISLTAEFFKDLAWFLAFLPSFNGVTYINKPAIVNGHSLHIDASLTGLGGIWNDEVYATPICNLFGIDLKIVHLEMLNLVIALRVWARKWTHSVVKFYCDNMAVVQVVQTARTKDQFLALCLRNIWLITASHDIDLHIEHIQGAHNVHADLLSRLYSNKVVDKTLLETMHNTCTWHDIPIQFFNLRYDI